MKISFYGNACFFINDGGFSLVTDPHKGIKAELKANAATLSAKDDDNLSADVLQGGPKILDWPGEYEIEGAHIQGIATFRNPKEDAEQKENTVFTIEMNGMNLCHLGKLGTKLITEQMDAIGDVDVLFVPVCGKGSLEPKKAKEIIEQIEPRVIIPMSYCDEDENCRAESLEPFLAEMGAKGIEPVNEFALKKSELPEDTNKIVVLNVK